MYKMKMREKQRQRADVINQIRRRVAVILDIGQNEK